LGKRVIIRDTMLLTPGARLDVYEILGPLGAGGMGEVYRARDSVLKREVAIKVLPPFVSQDPDRLRRFQQEAEAAAALNHPNILAVHQLGTFEGSPYLVSELLEGDTLRQLMQRGPLSVRKAIDFGVQIARGLAAAHEKGVVHRDLKPENLFVTKDGRVKILDFGLAKLTQRTPDPGESGPTLTHQGTEPGLVMGTVGYMAPEQVRGKPADHRADIFAFGAILYEMLAGKRAFEKPTSAETMTAILNEDPPAISQIAATTPPGLQRVVHRCLEKNPEQRFQSASDLAFALEAISESGISGSVASPKQPPHRVGRLLMWSSGVPAILALAAAAYYFATRHERVPFEHFMIQKASDDEHVNATAISPDGVYLASGRRDAGGARSLWVRHIPTGSERAILQDPVFKGYIDVIFSPDGGYLYFRVPALGNPPPDRWDVYRIPVLGGQPARVLAGVDAPLSFIDGGQRVCFFRADPVAGTYEFLSASADGGNEQVLAKANKPMPISAACAPSGRLAMVADEQGEVETLDFASGSKQMLTSMDGDSGYLHELHWDPAGKGVFAINMIKKPRYVEQLSYLSYPGGKLRQITNDLNEYNGISLAADGHTIATTQRDDNQRFGVIALAEPSRLEGHGPRGLESFIWMDNGRILASDDASALRVVDLLKDETATLNVAKDRAYIQPSLCGPDTLVSSGGSLGGHGEVVYKMHLDGSGPAPLTQGPEDLFPECTPDARWLFYADNRDPNAPILMRQPLRGGPAEKIKPASVWYNLSPNGKLLAIASGEGTPEIQILSTETLQKIQSFPAPPDFQSQSAFSADNQSILYQTQTGGDATIWRQSLGGSTPVKVVTLPGKYVYSIRASPDGKKLGLIFSTPTSEAVLVRDVH
jgi:serine/threonine protein kinase